MWRALHRHCSRFLANDRASLAVTGATLFPLVIGCAALAVDLGTIFADRRKTQSAADIAAMVAASNIASASRAATAAAVQNNYPSSAVTDVELGVYTPKAALSPSARFVPSGATGANAVRVTLNTQTPLYFARFFTGSDFFTIRASATATRSAMASFAIGSRTVALNNGLLNALLSQMFGAGVSLSASDYNSLLNAKIDVFSFYSQLASRMDVSGVNYDQLLSSTVKAGDLVVALQKANGSSLVTPVLNSLVASLGNLTQATPVSPIASIGPYGAMVVGSKPQTSVAATAFDLLAAIAQAANGSNQIATAVNLGLPGIASASVNVVIGQPPQGSSWVTTGPPGAQASTAQTRVQFLLQLVGSGSIALVSVPIAIEVARGTATLSTVSCGYPNVSSSTVAMAVKPGLVDAWIGSPTPAEFANLTTPLSPVAGTLLTLGAATVTGRAHATMGNTTPTSVSFGYADVISQTKKTVTTTNFTSSLFASLLGDLTLNVSLGPFGLPIPGLASAVSGILAGATSSIDQLLVTVLAMLGVGIGQADVWVSGIRCDGAVLVN
jgi:uncharacterized membrane protein